MKAKLPPQFTQRVEGAFGERGQLFVRALPSLIDEAVARWHLKDLQPADKLSYNYVLFARSGDRDVVLKIGVPDRELTSEIHALRHFAGRGAARLIDSDSGRGMLVLQRLVPGEPLASLSNDAEATQIAAEVMLDLLRPAPADSDLIQIADWCQGFKRYRAAQGGGTGPLDKKLFARAESLAREMLQEEHRPTLLHGDLHHGNVLSSGSRWAAVDPKGVVGPAAYEVGPLLLNPQGFVNAQKDGADVMAKRIAILAEVLGIQAERIRQCGVTHAVLSAVWSIEEGGDWRGAMECGRLISESGA